MFSSVGESSSSVHRLTPQQYNSGHSHLLSRSDCRAKPTSAERSLEIAAARKQVNQLNRALSYIKRVLN